MSERKDDRLWGGRFDSAPDARFDEFQCSFSFDRRLLPYEIAVDRAWAKALQQSAFSRATEVRSRRLRRWTKLPRARKPIKPGSILQPPRTFIISSKTPSSRNLGRSAGNCTPAAAATNWWPPISACSLSTPLSQIQQGVARLGPGSSAAGQIQSENPHGWHDPYAARPADSALAFPDGACGSFFAGSETARACRRERGRLPHGFWRIGWLLVSNRSDGAGARTGLFADYCPTAWTR